MTVPDWRPPHAYVPGQTPRHDEALFDALKATLADVPLDEVPETDAWNAALTCLREGYFWEAHELLEPVWMALPEGRARWMVQGLIQLANAGLKRRMGRAGAVARLEEMAETLLGRAFEGESGPILGLNRADIAALEKMKLKCG